jgi:hypothetical protein
VKKYRVPKKYVGRGLKEQKMTTVAKMTDGSMVEVVRVAETVGFSPEKGWVMVCIDFEKISRKREHFKWVPSTTRFEWVREFVFG